MVKPRVGLRFCLEVSKATSRVTAVQADGTATCVIEASIQPGMSGKIYDVPAHEWESFIAERVVLNAIEKGTRLRYTGTDRVLKISFVGDDGYRCDAKMEWSGQYTTFQVSMLEEELASGVLEMLVDEPVHQVSVQVEPKPVPAPLPGSHSVHFRKRVLATGLTMEAAEELRKQRLYYYGEQVEVV